MSDARSLVVLDTVAQTNKFTRVPQPQKAISAAQKLIGLSAAFVTAINVAHGRQWVEATAVARWSSWHARKALRAVYI